MTYKINIVQKCEYIHRVVGNFIPDVFTTLNELKEFPSTHTNLNSL